jgi:hypothetical protein
MLYLSPLAGRGRIALAIRVRGRSLKGDEDGFKDAICISKDIVIPKAQHSMPVPD